MATAAFGILAAVTKAVFSPVIKYNVTISLDYFLVFPTDLF